MNCDGLIQIDVKPAASCAGIAASAVSRSATLDASGKSPPRAAHHLELVHPPAGVAHLGAQPLQVLRARGAERVEPGAVADEAAQEPLVEPLPPEPQRRPLGPERLRFQRHLGERVMVAREGRGRLPPQHPPRGQVLVEQLAPQLERHAEGLVLVAVPTHGRLHDESAAAQQIERRELLRQQGRMAQRRDDRAGHQSDPLGRRRHRREEHQRARPRHPGILVPGERVVARVRGAGPARRRPAPARRVRSP